MRRKLFGVICIILFLIVMCTEARAAGPDETINFTEASDSEAVVAQEPVLGLGPVRAKAGESTQDLTFGYVLYSDWGSGFNAAAEITNLSGQTKENWVIEFDFEREITQIWNAEIVSHENRHYVIKDAGYNAVIQPGGKVSFGFNGTGGKASDEPAGFKEVKEDGENQAPQVDKRLVVEAVLARLQIGYREKDSDVSVTGDVTLPLEPGVVPDSAGVTISWSSSREDLISRSGRVVRPQDHSEWVTLTATVSLDGESVKGSYPVRVVKTGYNDYNAAEIEDYENYECLLPYNDGTKRETLRVYEDKEGYLTFLDGSYTDAVIDSPDEAVMSLYHLRTLTGIQDPKTELEWIQTSHDQTVIRHRFRQMHNGIPVSGGEICVVTDLNGRTRAVNSKIRHVSYNMAAPASPDAVQGIMTRGKDGMSRCIFNYRLDSAGDGWYCFEDYKRNIQACLWISTGRMERDYRNYSKLINWNDLGDLETGEIKPYAAMYRNVANAYDYFLNTYGRKSCDNRGGRLDLFADFELDSAFSRCDPETGIWALAFGENWMDDEKIAVHEFSHGVISEETALEDVYGSDLEASAINEAYADVFAQLYLSSPDWNFPGRDLKQIPASDEPVNNYYVQSRRISHTCYYMYEHGIRREKLQKIWYTSLLLGYSMFPDFEDVRRNLLAAAGLNGVSASEYQTIMDAFDEVQITDAPAFVSGMGAP